jgi:hypothetical protein
MTTATDTRRIHFLHDGLTSLGKVFTRGDELELTDEVLEETTDTKGHSWTSLTEDEQAERFGKVYFADGPFPETEKVDPYKDSRRTSARSGST